jgi:peroxiredoxin Q/BCP
MLGKRVPDFRLPSFYPQDNDVSIRAFSNGHAALCRLFELIEMKNTYRRKVRGIERSTFAVDEKRSVMRQWRGMKVPGHVQEVMNFVKAL